MSKPSQYNEKRNSRPSSSRQISTLGRWKLLQMSTSSTTTPSSVTLPRPLLPTKHSSPSHPPAKSWPWPAKTQLRPDDRLASHSHSHRCGARFAQLNFRLRLRRVTVTVSYPHPPPPGSVIFFTSDFTNVARDTLGVSVVFVWLSRAMRCRC